jgi:hypothetical protein
MPSCFVAGTADCRGFSKLADVPADDLDGESVRVFYYLRAVTSMATATLYERYRGVDASAKGDKKASIPLSTSCGGTCAGRYHASRTNPAAS